MLVLRSIDQSEERRTLEFVDPEHPFRSSEEEGAAACHEACTNTPPPVEGTHELGLFAFGLFRLALSIYHRLDRFSSQEVKGQLTNISSELEKEFQAYYPT